MKRLYTYSLLLLLLACLVLSAPNAYATYGGFELEPCTEEELIHYAKALDISFLVQEPSPRSIVSFDVSSNGHIVLGFADETVRIYSQDGKFLYGYTFNATSAFEVLWHNQNPAIYFYRSDKIITLDNSGKCISLERVINSNEMYIRHWLDGTSKTINGIQYKLERDIPIGNSYGRLCIVGADGNTSIIYDATKAENTSKILTICGVASFTGVVITLFVRKLKKEKPWENHYKAL